jgi:hypothetical protein
MPLSSDAALMFILPPSRMKFHMPKMQTFGNPSKIQDFVDSETNNQIQNWLHYLIFETVLKNRISFKYSANLFSRIELSAGFLEFSRD